MLDEDGTLREIIAGAAALVVMTTVGLAALVGITWVLRGILGDTVSAAILAAAAPIIATFSLGLWSDYRGRARTRELEQRRRRSRAYRQFLSFLYEAIRRVDDEDQPDELALDIDEYGEFVQDLLTWGSDELIELWNEFRQVDLETLDRREQHEWFARLLEQLRVELRGTDSELPREELYDLYHTSPGDEGTG